MPINTSADINQRLYQHFINYDYKLFCTFMFGGWESDFLARSSSGYYIEVEVKISRSDFLVDFKKEKHQFFKALHSKKTILVKKDLYGLRKGDILLRNFQEPKFVFRGYRRVEYGRNNRPMNGSEYLVEYAYHERDKLPQHKDKTYIINDWNFNRVDIEYERPKNLHAPSTNIEFVNLETENYPNQFYYAVSPDMVKPEEIPAYAGLLYVYEDRVVVVRRAPYLHKRKMDLTVELLRKFYNLWQYNGPIWKEKINILTTHGDESGSDTDTTVTTSEADEP